MSLITGGMYFFLYLPIIILIIISFNASPFSRQWVGFSLRWYHEVLESVEVWQAIKNSLIVAVSSVSLSLVMGLMTILFATRTSLQKFFLLFYGGLATPEIMLAVGLLSVLTFFSVPLGLVSIIIGHTLIGLSFVIPILYDRFIELDYALVEASMDLGATRGQTLFRVILPFLTPAILAAALLIFIISFDEFIIAFFCSGSSAQTLPIFIFSMIRSGEYSLVNAVSTLLLAFTGLLILLFSSLNVRKMGVPK